MMRYRNRETKEGDDRGNVVIDQQEWRGNFL